MKVYNVIVLKDRKAKPYEIKWYSFLFLFFKGSFLLFFFKGSFQLQFLRTYRPSIFYLYIKESKASCHMAEAIAK